MADSLSRYAYQQDSHIQAPQNVSSSAAGELFNSTLFAGTELRQSDVSIFAPEGGAGFLPDDFEFDKSVLLDPVTSHVKEQLSVVPMPTKFGVGQLIATQGKSGVAREITKSTLESDPKHQISLQVGGKL